MLKIYLVVCDVFNGGLLGFKNTYLSFTDKNKAQNYLNSIEREYNKFANWFEAMEDICQDLNHDKILELIEQQTKPREWKMQFSDYRMAHPELKLIDNIIHSFPELKEIVLI